METQLELEQKQDFAQPGKGQPPENLDSILRDSDNWGMLDRLRGLRASAL